MAQPAERMSTVPSTKITSIAERAARRPEASHTRPQRRPQQQQRADRLVEADQTLVGVEPPCEEGEVHAGG